MSSLVCSMTPARRSTGARATPARGRTAPPDSARRAAARSVTARPPARHRQPCRRGPAALGPARAVAVADPITGLIVTAVILRITWQSFNTVRSHPGEPRVSREMRNVSAIPVITSTPVNTATHGH